MRTKLFSVVVVLLALASQVSAQGLKIGYTSPDYILSLMPEAKSIEAELKAYEKQLQNQIQAKYNNLQTKMEEYQSQAGGWDDLIRTDKETEIQNLQQSIQKFQVDAENSLANKRNQLLGPVYEKIGNTIKQVAEENGYTHVFSAGSIGVDILLYAREQDDISNLIFAKLGITPPSNKK